MKSKQRVSDHGEVFTAKREVDAMLDFIKQETERIDSRFLEPACGNGNFLAEILKRKLESVQSKYSSNPPDYEKYAVVAVTGIYGVDILQDNVIECRKRMFEIFNREYSRACGNNPDSDCCDAVRFILKRNILCGDALTLKDEEGEPIVFSEWSIVSGTMMKRRDFRLDQMLEGHKKQTTLDMCDWEYDDEIKALIPTPIEEFPLIDYRGVQKHE